MGAEAAATKAIEDEAVKAANEQKGDQYYGAQKAKRRSLGLIKFIGELFKLQMLTERMMHEEVAGECGQSGRSNRFQTPHNRLDTHKARAHMDVYFS